MGFHAVASTFEDLFIHESFTTYCRSNIDEARVISLMHRSTCQNSILIEKKINFLGFYASG